MSDTKRKDLKRLDASLLKPSFALKPAPQRLNNSLLTLKAQIDGGTHKGLAPEAKGSEATVVRVKMPELFSRIRPLDRSRLPSVAEKHVGDVPRGARVMAARMLVPMSPMDSALLAYQLLFDEDAEVVKFAKRSFAKLDDLLFESLLQSERPESLSYLLTRVSIKKEQRLLTLLAQSSIPDIAFVDIALVVEHQSVIELIVQNGTRLKRCPEIVRSLAENPVVMRSDLDRSCDFLVREGIILDDVKEFSDAFARLSKREMFDVASRIPIDPKEQEAADKLLEKSIGDVSGDSAHHEEKSEKVQAGEEESSPGRRQSLTRFSIPVQVKLAMTGDHALAVEGVASKVRLVASAAIRNPKIRDTDIPKFARDKSLHDDVIRYICNNGDWTKAYAVKLALVQNPKTPQTIAVRWLPLLRVNDLKGLAKSKQVPSQVALQAKRLLKVRKK